MKNGFLTYRPIAQADAEMLLRWRLSPSVGRYMLTDVADDPVRQRAWIADCARRTDMLHRIMQIKGEDVGYCSIKIVDAESGIGTIGVYIGEAGVPASLTAFNFIHILNHACFAMGLHKIVNHILAINDRLVPAQKFNGYRHVGILREHVLRHGQRLDMHIVEQMAAEWADFRRKFGDWRDLDGGFWPPAPSATDDATGMNSGNPIPVSSGNVSD